MSILIKGMEMPENCIDCFAETYNECMATGKMVNSIGRPDWCPLVEVPKHGRLIDADKLTELCDIMADKCGEIGESIWGQFRATVEWSPIIIEAEE